MIKPKFKVGDWVRVNPEGIRAKSYHSKIVGQIFQISAMEYHEGFENNPSPWRVIGAAKAEWDLYEEDVILDPFMTAAANAVENSDGQSIPKKARTKNAA